VLTQQGTPGGQQKPFAGGVDGAFFAALAFGLVCCVEVDEA